MVVAGLVVAGCSDPAPTFGKSALDRDAWTETVSSLDTRFFNDASLNGWTTHPEARCYASVRQDDRSQAALDIAWCGPAYSLQSTDGIPWILYPLRGAPPSAGGSISVVASGEPRIPTSPVPTFVTFWRPDGRTPPANPPTYGIVKPAPPAAAPRTVFFEPSIPVAPFDTRDYSLRGVNTRVGTVQQQEVAFDLDVTGVSRRTLAEVNGELRSAPPGHAFMTWILNSSDSWTDLPDTALDVLIDGAVVLQVDVWGAARERYLTAVVEESSAVTLRLRDWNGWEQTLNLMSGKRSNAPVILYSGRDSLQSVSRTYQMPFQVIGRVGFTDYTDRRGVFPFGEYPHTLSVQGFALTWVAQTRFGTGSQPTQNVIFPTSTDRAFLTWVTSVSGGNTWFGTLQPEAFTLLLPDGTRQPAVYVGDWRGTACELVPNQIYFEVPADFTSGVIEVKPGRSVSRIGCNLFGSALLDYRDTRVEVEVLIPIGEPSL